MLTFTYEYETLTDHVMPEAAKTHIKEMARAGDLLSYHVRAPATERARRHRGGSAGRCSSPPCSPQFSPARPRCGCARAAGAARSGHSQKRRRQARCFSVDRGRTEGVGWMVGPRRDRRHVRAAADPDDGDSGAAGLQRGVVGNASPLQESPPTIHSGRRPSCSELIADVLPVRLRLPPGVAVLQAEKQFPIVFDRVRGRSVLINIVQAICLQLLPIDDPGGVRGTLVSGGTDLDRLHAALPPGAEHFRQLGGVRGTHVNPRRQIDLRNPSSHSRARGVKLRRAFGFGRTNESRPVPAARRLPQRAIRRITSAASRGIRIAASRRSPTSWPAASQHGDSLGQSWVDGPGDVQWMTAGSGILHQEMPKGDERGRMHGFQLWANLPRRCRDD